MALGSQPLLALKLLWCDLDSHLDERVDEFFAFLLRLFLVSLTELPEGVELWFLGGESHPIVLSYFWAYL